MRLGRERVGDDLASIEAVREAVGSEMKLMVDFNRGLHPGEALERCHAVDDLGLAWIEEPIVYDNIEGYARLTANLKTPVQIGENFYGPRALYTALQMKNAVAAASTRFAPLLSLSAAPHLRYAVSKFKPYRSRSGISSKRTIQIASENILPPKGVHP